MLSRRSYSRKLCQPQI